MWDATIEESVLISRCRILPMTSNTTLIAGVEVSDNTSSIGGFTVNWSDENEAATSQVGKFKLLRSTRKNARCILKPRMNLWLMAWDSRSNCRPP
jgi:hypothetical protein